VHCGSHPLYGISACFVDLDKFQHCLARGESPLNSETHVRLGDLTPGHALQVDMRLRLGQGDAYSYNIFFTARNGSFTQLLRYRRVNGVWKCATRVERGPDPKFVRIDDGFPCSAGDEPNWDD
jgi:hypothetical protein